MGLDSGALKDIIESGPVKGAQLAASILGGGAKEAIAQINSLQKAISFSGAAIGQYGADAAFGGLTANAQAQLARLTEAELTTRTRGNNQFIQQGAFQVVVNTSGAANTEEEIKMITDKIEQTFAILAKELAAK
jgi:aspartate/methionine/tyrosine aminotransferase